jgi:2-methylcitrate dehydratase PrpD
MSYTQELITLIRGRAISSADREAAALFVLDALASAYAGSATAVGGILQNWAAGSHLDAKRRAFLAGALTHITETDDLHRASVTHPGCVVVPVALALGEATGASGEQVLRGVLHGFEAMCRIGAAVGPAHYRVWHNTATCGPFGSAMAAAALLQLDDRQAMHALGNAGTQASGLWQFIEDGSMSKHLHAGRAAESGWLAAELAKYGLTGPAEILEGPKGFFTATCADPAPEKILAEPDAPWQLAQTSIKPWPSCRHTHPVIDCALALHRKLDGAEAREVTIETYQAALDVCDNPVAETEYQAKFSLQHTAAIALLDGAVDLGSFDEDARQRSGDLCSRVSAVAADPWRSDYPVSWGARVSVTTANGDTIVESRKDCRGDPELALDGDAMRAKAMGLLQYGGLDESAAKQLCDSVLALPSASTCAPLFSDLLRHAGVD